MCQVLDRNTRIELPEQRVRESGVIGCRDVIEAPNQELEEKRFGDVPILVSKDSNGSGLRGDVHRHRVSFGREQNAGGHCDACVELYEQQGKADGDDLEYRGGEREVRAQINDAPSPGLVSDSYHAPIEANLE